MENEVLLDPKLLANMQAILVDIIAGDDTALARPEYRSLSMGTIQQALKFLVESPYVDDKQRAYLIANSWRINYRDKPPSVEEFITEKYIGRAAIHTYDRVKTTFVDFMNPTKPYRNLVLYPHIGWGKSYLATLINIYVGVHLSLMRNPYKFFGLNPASVLSQLLVSYSLKKSSELLLEPLIAILEASPFFEKVHTRDGMVKRDQDFERQSHIDKIYWTTAVPTSAIQFSNGANFKLVSNVQNLLGLSVVTGTMSELAFFRDAGKALTLDTKIATPSGPRFMKDLQVGDSVISPEGDPLAVLRVIPQGKTKTYKFTFRDGRQVKCNPEHEWKVSYNQGKWEVLTAAAIKEKRDQRALLDKENTWKVPLSAPLPMPAQEHFIHPYLLGALLGDGSFQSNSLNLSIGDIRDQAEQRERISKLLPPGYTTSWSEGGRYLRFIRADNSTNRGNRRLRKNEIAEEIKRLGLTETRSATKFIPESYIYDSIENRVELLRGLLDTDGHAIADRPDALFSSTSLLLANQVIEIVRSLGGMAKLDEDNSSKKIKESYLTVYTVSIRFNSSQYFSLFHLSRKKAIAERYYATPRKQNYGLSIVSIEEIEEEETQCITVNSSDGLFALADGTVTHNSDEYIMRMFNDLKNRIDSRMKGNYFGRSILDSSPNTLDSPIDDYVVNQAHKDPTNYIVDGSQWKWAPEEYDMSSTFRVYTGGKGQPPRIIDEAEILEGINPSKIIEVPSSLKQFFTDDLYKALKDRAGIPAGSADSLIYDYSKIEKIFDERLRNVYTHITASSEDSPSRLIWNQVSHMFFKQKAGKLEFWYKPHLPRCISVDQSLSQDVSCIAASHVERIAGTDEQMYVVDFTIPIAPMGARVNLDAIRLFIQELRDVGGMNISHVSFDQFQSEAAIQYLKTQNFEVEKLSVDLTTDPYFYLMTLIETGKIVLGRNLYVKNNLKSLKIVKPNTKTGRIKVDHEDARPVVTAGSTEWEKSMIGFFAKDATDAIAGSVELLRRYHPVAYDSWEPARLDSMFNATAEKADAKKKMQAFLSSKGISA